jgi:hypothetical protein
VSRRKSTVVSAATISTVNITGFLTIVPRIEFIESFNGGGDDLAVDAGRNACLSVSV